MIKRRQFIAGLGSAAAWPVVVRAQQPDRMRRVAVLMALGENEAASKVFMSALTQGLSELGWSDGRNLRIDVRWAADVILTDATPVTAAVQRETRTIPIVFVFVSDPIGSGFVASLPRPGGNITGFSPDDPRMGGKWLQLLTEIAPGVKRAAFMFNPDTAPYVSSYYLPSFAAAARTIKVTPIIAAVRGDAEIEAVISSLGQEAAGGLVSMADNFMLTRRALIISLAARNNVPAVHYDAYFVRDGGLLSYGADEVDSFHRSASYVDRILRGTKPAELPVQLPTKFVMAINLKTAKALGLTIPETLLATADEVIQ